MPIPFTQYLLPDGRTRSISIDMPADIEEKAFDLIYSGCHFDAEILTTGMVSLTCEDTEDLVAIKVCPNGPSVVTAVRELIESAYTIIKGE